MWNELESYKHHFLQKELPHMKPVAITPLFRTEFDSMQKRHEKCHCPRDVPFKCEKSTYFFDRAQLAYGLGALPKLMRELCSDDLTIQWRAINSLSEFLMNPLNAQRAITEFDIVRVLRNAFLRHRMRYTREKYREVERMLEIFRIAAIYLNGAKAIAKRHILCGEFYKIILKDEKHAALTSAILRNLTEKPDVLVFRLEESESLNKLSEIFAADNCRPCYPYALWVHLSHFLEVAPDRAIELGFFELLYHRIREKYPDFHKMGMKCFALLLRCAKGQQMFDEIDGVSLLYTIMTNDLECLDTYEYVIMAFLHGLQSKKAMWRCREFTNLPKILTKFALKRNHRNKRLQLYALKALRQLCEMRSIKDYMRINCEHNLRTLKCLNEDNECERDRLVHWLNRDIFEIDCEIR